MALNSKSVFANLIWKFLERCGAQGVTFIVTIVLARLLDPEVYGTIALVTVFTTILQVFVDSGFGVALVQKKDSDDLDFSTVFYFNIVFSIFLYLLIFFCAPLISNFYDKPELTIVVRVVSIQILISGIRNVQQSYVSKTMKFKKFFYSTLFSSIGSAVVGIVMAYSGFGIWALVGQQLSSTFFSTLHLWMAVKWRPKFMFSITRLKILFKYGWKLLVSALIETVYSNIRTLIIGKLYTESDLAFYNKGRSFPNLFVSNINSTIDSVLFPAMSSEQDDKTKIKAMTRRAIKTSTYIMMPMMVGFAVCAQPLIEFLLTETWLPCVPYIRIFCFTFAFYPIHTANLNAIKALGRSDLFLKLEIIKKVIGLTFLIVSIRYGVLAMAYTMIITSIINQIVNSYPNKKLLGYNYLEQIKDISENMILSIIMGALVFCISLLNLPSLLIVAIQVILGVVIYVLGSIALKLESFKYILLLVQQKIKR